MYTSIIIVKIFASVHGATIVKVSVSVHSIIIVKISVSVHGIIIVMHFCKCTWYYN